MARNDQPEYKAWKAMKARCYAPCNKHKGNYQAKGIEVCERWINSYENFLEDMGRKPTGKHTLDRINNNGNYEPNNCRWLLQEGQSRNRGEFHKMITYQGETKMLKDWARHFGINYTTLHRRLNLGKLDFEDAIKPDPYKRLIELNGESKILKEWCNQFNIKYELIVDRVHRGKNAKEELIKEINKQKHNKGNNK